MCTAAVGRVGIYPKFIFVSQDTHRIRDANIDNNSQKGSVVPKKELWIGYIVSNSSIVMLI